MKLITKKMIYACFFLAFSPSFFAMDKESEETEKEKADFAEEEHKRALTVQEDTEYDQENALHYATLTGNNQPEPQRAKKRKEAIQLIEKAVVFFKKNDVLTSAQAFSRSPAWRRGDLSVKLVCKDEDICLSYGDNTDFIWQDATKKIYLALDNKGTPLKDLYDASIGDGWAYQFILNSMRESYVRSVVKDGKIYLLSAGCYPSSVDFTASIVTKNAAKDLADPFVNPLEEINNPHGKYVAGDIAVSLYTMNGDCIAHGKNRALIGQNRINLKDSNGKFIIRDIIEKIKNGSAEGFMAATWDNIPIKIMYKSVRSHWNPFTPYAEKDTLIALSYYYLEESGKRNLKDLLSLAIKHFEVYGKEKAFKDFSNIRGQFCRAGMHIEVYDVTGKCFANGESPELVNLNLLNLRDKHSNYIIKDLIKETEVSKYAFKSFFYKNANKIYYARLVKGIDGTFIISASFYIHSKISEATYLVKSAIEFLEGVSFMKAFYEFTNRSGSFVRGDLFVAVYRQDGTCLVNGAINNLIWEKVTTVKDKKGYPILKQIIDQANAGGGWVSYADNNGKKYVYSESVDVSLGGLDKKERLIVTSGYYL